MPRPQRIEYPGALYHVTTRGVRQDALFVDDRDRMSLLTILARALRTCDAQLYAFCLMGNHYHFVLQTRHANLSVLMHRVNSIFSLTFNQRHGRRGQVFDGRFKALHVDRDAYLLEVCRYVDLNPVRAGLVESPEQWAWSSYRAHTGAAPSLPWLATADLHGALVGEMPSSTAKIAAAEHVYADWVRAGVGAKLWKDSLRYGLYLGDEAFVERTRLRER
ncbi:MAG: transposase [Betaproteobacteria bacterium]